MEIAHILRTCHGTHLNHLHFNKVEVKKSTKIESYLQRQKKPGREHIEFIFFFSEEDKMKELEELRKKLR